MPWLSRQNSADESSKPFHETPKHHMKLPRSSAVNFIPAQIDGLCGTTPAHHKQTALRLLWADLRLIMQNINCLPAMLMAQCSPKVLRSRFGSPIDARDTILQVCLAFIQVWMLAFTVPAFLILPGSVFAVMGCLCWLVILAMTWPLSGSVVVTSDSKNAPMADDFSDECWIYVNSVMCSNRSLRAQCTHLSRIFGRPVTGVHNRTSGMIIDLINLLIQRSLNMPTPCTLAVTSQIRDACLTNSIRKVIVLSHSTGSLHVSIALDQLHANLPVEVLSKLEIYTFGSGATHLSNPCLRIDNGTQSPGSDYGGNNTTIVGGSLYTRPDGSIASPVKATLASQGHRAEDHERVIPHVEHYALASDIFARCGVLHNVRNVLDNRFGGRVFVIDSPATNSEVSMVMMRSHTSTTGIIGMAKTRLFSAIANSFDIEEGGYLLTEDYLDLLFPINKHSTGEIFDKIVSVDIATAEKREFTAQGVALPQKSFTPPGSRRTSGEHKTSSRTGPGHHSSPEVSPRTHNRSSASGKDNYGGNRKRASWETAAAMGFGGVGKARVGAKDCEGKSMRQLSRLWRYVGSGRPIGEGVPFPNSVGNDSGVSSGVAHGSTYSPGYGHGVSGVGNVNRHHVKGGSVGGSIVNPKSKERKRTNGGGVGFAQRGCDYVVD